MIIRRVCTQQLAPVERPYREFLAEHARELLSLRGRDGNALIDSVNPQESTVTPGRFVTLICLRDREHLAEYEADWLKEMVGRVSECYPEMQSGTPPFKSEGKVFNMDSPEEIDAYVALTAAESASLKSIPFSTGPALKAPGAPSLFGSAFAATSSAPAFAPTASHTATGMQNS